MVKEGPSNPNYEANWGEFNRFLASPNPLSVQPECTAAALFPSSGHSTVRAQVNFALTRIGELLDLLPFPTLKKGAAAATESSPDEGGAPPERKRRSTAGKRTSVGLEQDNEGASLPEKQTVIDEAVLLLAHADFYVMFIEAWPLRDRDIFLEKPPGIFARDLNARLWLELKLCGPDMPALFGEDAKRTMCFKESLMPSPIFLLKEHDLRGLYRRFSSSLIGRKASTIIGQHLSITSDRDIGALPRRCRPQDTRIGTHGALRFRGAIPRRFNRNSVSSR